MVGGLRDVITCAEFQIEIFMGYDFTGGRIFDFPIDFSMGLTTVQRYCAACDNNNPICKAPKALASEALCSALEGNRIICGTVIAEKNFGIFASRT